MKNIHNINDAWLNLGPDFKEDLIFNPLEFVYGKCEGDITNIDRYLSLLMTKPEYFSFVCKYIFNVEISPLQSVLLADMWNRKFPMLIGSRGLSKSFSLALYSMLRAFLLPQRKIVVVGAAFRQSKVLYDYCDTIWKNAPVLRDVCDSNSGLTRDVDRCQVKINDGTIVFLPLGDGCLTADTSVMYGDRFGLLGDLFDKSFTDELDIPNFSKISLFDGATQRNSPFKRYNGLKKTIKITTELGYSIEGTFDHKIMSFSGWKRLRDFRVGDLLEISLAESWHSGKSSLTENEAYNIGKNLSGDSIPREILCSPKNITKAFLRGVFHQDVYLFSGRGVMGGVLMDIIARCGQLSQQKNGKISLIEGGPPVGQNFFDRVVNIEYGENLTYDIEVDVTHRYTANSMISHNSKIRGQRAHDIINDEMASTPKEIFENVVAGFAAVASSPIEKIKKRATEKMAEELGIELEEEDLSSKLDFYKSNQIILSGTAYYDFNHFAEYWKRYCAIIKSGGDRNKLAEVFGGEVPFDFNWRDYAVYRIPVDLLPPGYMDEGQIARSKATVHSGIFDMEYGAVFSTDSKGFFKRSLIESCVCSEKKPIVLPSGEVFFSAVTRGNAQSKYVIGVDPASEEDNFSIVVLEVMPDHRRVVYAWTTTRERYRESFKSSMTNEDNFYGYCARKIRDLMKTFPTIEIALDSQGGGIAIMEALHDRTKLETGELPIWPIIDPEKAAETDGEPGLHILRLCKFVDAMWTAEANHGMRKDLEDKVLIFPFFDSATLGFSLEDDKKANRISDTLEDCVVEIEQLKDELALITLLPTPSGREKWDTPHGGFSSKTKSKLRKDRYSALLMANDCARRMLVERTGIQYDEDYYNNVGFAERFVSKDSGQENFNGPAWFTECAKDLY